MLLILWSGFLKTKSADKEEATRQANNAGEREGNQHREVGAEKRREKEEEKDTQNKEATRKDSSRTTLGRDPENGKQKQEKRDSKGMPQFMHQEIDKESLQIIGSSSLGCSAFQTRESHRELLCPLFDLLFDFPSDVDEDIDKKSENDEDTANNGTSQIN